MQKRAHILNQSVICWIRKKLCVSFEFLHNSSFPAKSWQDPCQDLAGNDELCKNLITFPKVLLLICLLKCLELCTFVVEKSTG